MRGFKAKWNRGFKQNPYMGWYYRLRRIFSVNNIIQAHRRFATVFCTAPGFVWIYFFPVIVFKIFPSGQWTYIFVKMYGVFWFRWCFPESTYPSKAQRKIPCVVESRSLHYHFIVRWLSPLRDSTSIWLSFTRFPLLTVSHINQISNNVFEPMNAHVVDGSSVYFQYGLILSLILNLWNKDIAFRVEPQSIHEICYLIQSIAEQNVISERHHVCRSLCVLMLHSHLTDFLSLWQHFFWDFSGGTTVPSNVTSTGKSQTGTIRYRGSLSRWLIGVIWLTVWCCVWQLDFSSKHVWPHFVAK